MTTISVIVPVYNAEDTLERCVGSILAQTHADLDIILIDDGSTDISGAMCDAYAEFDPRVRASHTPNRGLSAARNLGINWALEGDCACITFVDADDYLDSDFLEKLVRTMESQQVDLVQCGHVVDGFTGAQLHGNPPAHYKGRDVMRAHIAGELTSLAWDKLYARRLFEQASTPDEPNPNESAVKRAVASTPPESKPERSLSSCAPVRYPDGRNFEDVATTHIVLSLCKSVARIPDCSYHYVMRPDSITHTHSIGNLADYWEAYVERRKFILETAGEWLGDQEKNILRKDVAGALSMVWRWAYDCKKKGTEGRTIDGKNDENLDEKPLDELLVETKTFARCELSPLSKRGWPTFIRLSALLARIGNIPALAAMYYLNQAFTKLLPECSSSRR